MGGSPFWLALGDDRGFDAGDRGWNGECGSDGAGGREYAERAEMSDENLDTQPTHPIVEMTDADLAALLVRAVRVTAVLGAAVALFLGLALGWGSAALFAVGAGISAASIWEWGRLIRLFNAKLDQQKVPGGAGLVVGLFLVRLVLFAGVIYGSLKCFQGSPIVLVCGLGLAVVGLVWEAVRLLRG